MSTFRNTKFIGKYILKLSFFNNRL